MRKKSIVSLILSGIMALTMAGCGSSASVGTTSKAESTKEASSGIAAAEEADSTGKVAGKKNISLWHYFTAADAPMIDDLCKEYNKEHPDVNIVPTYVSRDELMNQYTIGAVSGELPDIGMVDSPDMASYISLGVFEDISSELNDWGELKQFYKGPLSSCEDSDGKVYGLPQNSDCLALVVNMDLLKKAGYDHTPTSADEFKDMVAKTTDKSTKTYGFAMSAVSNEEGTFQLIPWLEATRDGVTGSVSDLTNSTSVKNLQMLGDFVKNGYMSTECANWAQADAYNQFTAGKAAFEEFGTWQLPSIAKDVNGKFNYKVCLLPTGDKGSSTSVIGGENFGVCKGSKYKDICVDFLKFFCSKEEEGTWCAKAGKLPTRKDATVNYTFEQDNFKVFQDQLQTAVARGPHAEWPSISEAIYTAGQSVLVNGTSAKDALKKAKATIDPIIKKSPLPKQS